jgi:methyl-accepting chemotaxis protein
MKIRKGFKSVHTSFLAWILPTILVVIISLATLIFQQAYKHKKQEVEDYLIQVAEGRANHIGELFNEYKLDLTWLASNKEASLMDWSLLKENHLSIEIKRKDVFGTVGLVIPDGRYYVTPVEGISEKSHKGRDFHDAIFIQKLDFFFSAPYISAVAGQPVVTLAVAVKDSMSTPVGIVGASVKLDLISKICSDIKVGNAGYAWIIDNQGLVCAFPDTSKLMKFNFLESSKVGYKDLDKLSKDIIKKENGVGTIITPMGEEEILVYCKIPNTPGWTLGISVPSTAIYKDIRTQRNSIILMFILTMFMLTFIIWYISTIKIKKPLHNLIDYVKAIAEGNLVISTTIDSRDEIGQMSTALNEMLERLCLNIKRIKESAEIIGDNAKEVDASAATVATGANQQAATTEEVSSSMEEMLASIHQNAEYSMQIEKSESKAVTDIEITTEAVKNNLTEFSTIAERVQIITSIAQQTNILAINAAIEAARAGVHGKGFSVVATEVRKLAEMTKQAADEISKMTDDRSVSSEHSMKLLSDVVPLIKQNAKKVFEIRNSATEQSNSAEHVNKAISNLSTVFQNNAAASEEMAAKSKELSKQSDELNEIISYYQIT